MSAMASQITDVSIVYSTICSASDQRKHKRSASLAFVRDIHRWPMNSPHKGPVPRKIFPFHDVTMGKTVYFYWIGLQALYHQCISNCCYWQTSIGSSWATQTAWPFRLYLVGSFSKSTPAVHYSDEKHRCVICHWGWLWSWASYQIRQISLNVILVLLATMLGFVDRSTGMWSNWQNPIVTEPI